MGDIDNDLLRPSRLSAPSILSVDSMTPSEDPPPYEATAWDVPNNHLQPPVSYQRTFSSDVLPPSPSASDRRRKLLLVWIHGFMGDEGTFQSFPAHVHDFLANLVATTHVVHSKIYPRYLPKKELKVARDSFSAWLHPHEVSNTDVILLGHSMGGILAAEVALMPASGTNDNPFNHNVLGVVGLDAPFLGMHPGVLGAGIKSMFRPAPARQSRELIPSDIPPNRPASPTPSYHTTASTAADYSASSDTNFNPSYFNDKYIPARSMVMNAAHFINKHRDNLRSAAKQSMSAYMEFGSCLADYPMLKDRYTRIRMLEVEDPRTRAAAVGHGRSPPRVRFVNYYTASEGIKKKPKMPEKEQDSTAIARAVSEPPSQSALDEKNAIRLVEERADLQRSATSPDASTLPQFPPSSLSPTASHVTLELEDSDDDEISFSDAASITSDVSDADSITSDLSDVNSIHTLDTLATTAYDPSIADVDTDVDDEATPRNLSRTATITPSDTKREIGAESGPIFPRPPIRSDYGDKIAYKEAIKLYRKQFKEYVHNYKNYHVHAKKQQRQNEKRMEESFKEEWNSRLQVDKELQKAFHATSREDSKRSTEAYKEESKRAADAYKDEWKAHMDIEKDYRSEWKDADAEERKRIDEAIKENRSVLEGIRKAYFEDRKASIEAWKDVRKQDFEMRKAAMDALQNLHHENSTYWKHAQKIQAKVEKRTEKDSAKLEKKYKKKLRKAGECSKYSLPGDADTSSVDETLRGSEDAAPYILEPVESPASFGRSESKLSTTSTASSSGSTKPSKERKFCALPPKDASGNRDPAWVRIYIEGVDEVGAHCGLFFPKQPDEEVLPGGVWTERYANFVRDVAERIHGWANDAATQRLLEDMRRGLLSPQ